MKKYLILLFLLIASNAYCMKRSSWFSFDRFKNPLRITSQRFYFTPRSYTSYSNHFSKIFNSRMLSSFYLTSHNHNEKSIWKNFVPVLIVGTALYKSSSWGKKVYAEQKEDTSLTSLAQHIKTHFVQIITDQEGMKLFQHYCTQLRKNENIKEHEGMFEKEMAHFAQIFIDSLSSIIPLLPSSCLSDFFFKIVPLLESSLLKDCNEAMKKAFKQHCATLIRLCNNKNSYSLYALIKLFIKCNGEEHEALFLDELFKQFNDLDDVHHLGVIQTTKGKKRVVEYCAMHLKDACNKYELLDQLCYWIYCDLSLAEPLLTEECIRILLQTKNGHLLLPHLIRANSEAKNLIEKVNRAENKKS